MPCCIQLFNKYLQCSFCAAGTVLGIGTKQAKAIGDRNAYLGVCVGVEIHNEEINKISITLAGNKHNEARYSRRRQRHVVNVGCTFSLELGKALWHR